MEGADETYAAAYAVEAARTLGSSSASHQLCASVTRRRQGGPAAPLVPPPPAAPLVPPPPLWLHGFPLPMAMAHQQQQQQQQQHQPFSSTPSPLDPLPPAFIISSTTATPSTSAALLIAPPALHNTTPSHHRFLRPADQDGSPRSNGAPAAHSSEHDDDSGLPKRPKLGAEPPACSLHASKNQTAQSQAARSKERLGEKITALQQLVSPFGKTDTASVLSEAIGYIKFLQEQVQVLSSPYMKSAINRQDSGAFSSTRKMGSEGISDLRSRGLCLVPVSCTLNVASSNGADYWTSGVGGSRH